MEPREFITLWRAIAAESVACDISATLGGQMRFNACLRSNCLDLVTM
jgi:hypothetical protein